MIVGILQKLIDIECGEIGVRETGQNYVKYNDWYWGSGVGGADYPWCVVFQGWCCNQLNGAVPFPKTAHCNGVESYAKEHGQWVTGDYKVGDFVIFDYNSDGNRDHIGFIVGIGEGSYVTTVEGNYSDAVSRVFRKTSEFIGAYRPDYGEDADAEDTEPDEEGDEDFFLEEDLPVLVIGDTGKEVEALQALLDLRGYRPSNSLMGNGKWDGDFGSGTFNALKNATGSGTCVPETWIRLIKGELI